MRDVDDRTPPVVERERTRILLPPARNLLEGKNPALRRDLLDEPATRSASGTSWKTKTAGRRCIRTSQLEIPP